MLVNTEGTGFYRVRYAPDLRAALVAHAQTDLSPIERYGLVDDAWAAVLAGRLHDASTSSTLAEASATRPTCRCGSASSAALGSLDRLVDGDARERAPGARSATLVAPGARAARPRARSTARPTATASCAAC